MNECTIVQRTCKMFLISSKKTMLLNRIKNSVYKKQLSQLGLAAQEKFNDAVKMKAWQVHSYGEDLQLSHTRIPILNSVDSILVKVDAASLNPIDLYMKDGYARNVLNLLRRNEMELPLTLGRDFSGTIIRKGLLVDEKYKIGDRVYGFVPLHCQGSFAEYVIAQNGHFQHQPDHLNNVESASIVYTSMTAWSALFVTGGLAQTNLKNKKVLVLGASGGVGTMAVQLLKSHGVHVSGSCATDAVSLVRSLGADEIFDYTKPDHVVQISENRYDIILDCAKFGIERVPKDWKFSQFITLNSPLMHNTDKLGLVAGLLKSSTTLVGQNLVNLKDGRSWKWGFFIPSDSGFKLINKLVRNGQLKAAIHKVFTFDKLPDAINEVKQGHLRGKVTVSME